jgi:hypothetical protein
MSRVRRVNTQQEMRLLADDFVTRGYKIRVNRSDSIRLKSRDWGSADDHLVIAVVSGWWTFGLSNILYAVYKHVTAEEILIKVDKKIDSRK